MISIQLLEETWISAYAQMEITLLTMVVIYLVIWNQTIKTWQHEDPVGQWKVAASSTDNDDSQCRKRKYTAEHPPRNSDVIDRARGGQVPEIKQVKNLNFKKPDKQQDKTDYSDKIDMDDEIQSTLRDIEKTTRITAENLLSKDNKLLI